MSDLISALTDLLTLLSTSGTTAFKSVKKDLINFPISTLLTIAVVLSLFSGVFYAGMLAYFQLNRQEVHIIGSPECPIPPFDSRDGTKPKPEATK